MEKVLVILPVVFIRLIQDIILREEKFTMSLLVTI